MRFVNLLLKRTKKRRVRTTEPQCHSVQADNWPQRRQRQQHSPPAATCSSSGDSSNLCNVWQNCRSHPRCCWRSAAAAAALCMLIEQHFCATHWQNNAPIDRQSTTAAGTAAAAATAARATSFPPPRPLCGALPVRAIFHSWNLLPLSLFVLQIKCPPATWSHKLLPLLWTVAAATAAAPLWQQQISEAAFFFLLFFFGLSYFNEFICRSFSWSAQQQFNVI